MRIRFGLHLDGERGWRAANRLGEAVMGPLGLLATLEIQSGLAGELPSHSERVLQYRDCLKRCMSASRFYHASFGTDELGTAAQLLEWRDTWHLHGWDGSVPAGASHRLADLADVERLAVKDPVLSASVGERLKCVAGALAKRPAAVEVVELTDALEVFPKRWQEVLSRLPVKQAGALKPCDAGTLLGQLQRTLGRIEAGEKSDRIPWRDDGTVRVNRAETNLAAGRWLAEEMRHLSGDAVLVAPSEGEILDAVLEAADTPRHGLETASMFRPALQVLPLALRTLWEPLDVHALLKFLSHPVCPVPTYARRILAGELAERPGIGGRGWASALTKIADHYADRAVSVRESIQFWVEHDRFSHQAGAPLPAVLDRVRRLTEYLGKRLGDHDTTEQAGFAAGYTQGAACAASLEALQRQGDKTIGARQLQTLLLQATGSGTVNPLAYAEAGCMPAVNNSSAVIETFDKVIWWHLAAPSMPRRYPWSLREIGELSAAGVTLPSLDGVLAQTAREWLRPILAARKALVLLLPPMNEEVHPVWLAIESLVENIPIHSIESVLAGEKKADGVAEVPLQPLPLLRRWWSLPKDVSIGRRTQESYSSLNLFLNNPYQWVLQYQARLRPSSILSVASDFLLYGNLAHRMVEHYYHSNAAIGLKEAAFDRWFEKAFAQIVHEEGAVLLMRGRRGDLERLRAKLKRAFAELQRQFVAAGAIEVEPEKELAGQFVGGELSGIADLVIRKAKNSQAIVDMKWSGVTGYRERLANGQHLQLAVYGELLRQGKGAWPGVAYFILDRPLLLAANSDFFPEARVVQTPDGEAIAPLWQRFLKSWQWRRAQVDAGQIEVVLEEIESTEESDGPEDGLEVETLNPAYNNYLLLAGWKE